MVNNCRLESNSDQTYRSIRSPALSLREGLQSFVLIALGAVELSSRTSSTRDATDGAEGAWYYEARSAGSGQHLRGVGILRLLAVTHSALKRSRQLLVALSGADVSISLMNSHSHCPMKTHEL